jgi:FkbM family methyltransferase
MSVGAVRRRETSFVSLIHRTLMRIRPEPLAAVLKTVLRVSRREIETPFGRFFVDPASNFGIRLISVAVYEPDETSIILEVTRNARSFVDVGANEGYFSVIASMNMPKGGKVIAIEPQLRLLPILQKNMELNGILFDVLSSAISDCDGVAAMFFSSSINTGTSGFVRTTRYPRPRKTVRVARLESVLKDARISTVDCMKIDIEGLEYEAIMGSRRLFESRSIKHILIQMHPDQMSRRGHDPGDLTEFLQECGYRNDGAIWYIA